MFFDFEADVKKAAFDHHSVIADLLANGDKELTKVKDRIRTRLTNEINDAIEAVFEEISFLEADDVLDDDEQGDVFRRKLVYMDLIEDLLQEAFDD